MPGTTMKAAVLRELGVPEILTIEHLPIPAAKPGWVLIQIRAFGLNWSESFTRQGLSPDVKFPRSWHQGGRACGERARATQVQLVKTQLPWKTLGAVPGMLQTAWGSLFRALLRLQKAERLLIRAARPTSLYLERARGDLADQSLEWGAHRSAASSISTRSLRRIARWMRRRPAEKLLSDFAGDQVKLKHTLFAGYSKYLPGVIVTANVISEEPRSR